MARAIDGGDIEGTSLREAIKILFIEDDADDVFLTERSLLNAGLDIECLTVQNEESLVLALEHWKPDVVLSDFSLPRLTGKRAFEVSNQRAPTVPFIFVSGGVPGRIAADFVTRGALAFIEKGDHFALAHLVESCISKRQHT